MMERKYGLGTLSIVIYILGILFDLQLDGHKSVGDRILNDIGIKTWSNTSNGIHYTIFYSMIIFVSSLIIGIKYKDDYGGKLGRNLSIVTLIIFLILAVFIINW